MVNLNSRGPQSDSVTLAVRNANSGNGSGSLNLEKDKMANALLDYDIETPRWKRILTISLVAAAALAIPIFGIIMSHS